MKLATNAAVPVYTVSGSSTARPLPDWLIRKRRRSLKNDPEFANRIELLQDFSFEEASCCVRVSEDGDWVMSTGTYKPQIHVHHLPQLSLSFSRHTDALNQTFCLLAPDYSKSLHLQSDRSLEFHTPQGCHYTIRVPRYARDLKYNRRAAEALIPAVGVDGNGNGEVFRLNLELGQFMKGYDVYLGGDEAPIGATEGLQGGINAGSVNAVAIAETSHNLLAFGTSLGTVEFWDSRSRSRIALMGPAARAGSLDERAAITTVEFDQSGLTFATGSSDGLIHLYDLRSPNPLLSKDQGYGYPIQTVKFLSPSTSTRTATSESKILSADKRIIKLWDPRNGDPWTAVEPAVDLNHVEWVPDSGMLLTANEGQQQHCFFIPQLGPAPRWCMFLDNLVEEMAEDANDPNTFGSQKPGEVYDNYKFLTMPQLETLSLDHLIGTTSLLRPYMHGYFVAQRLYEEARLIANPDLWREQRTKSIQEKIEKERESRVRGNKKVAVKVNRKLAEKIMAREEKNEIRRAQRVLERGGDDQHVAKQKSEEGAVVESKSNADAKERPNVAETKSRETLLTDERFTNLFKDEDFEVDETSKEFRDLNPSTAVANSKNPYHRRLTAVEEEMLSGASRSPTSSDQSSSSEDDISKEEDETVERKKKSDPLPKRSSRGPRAEIGEAPAGPVSRMVVRSSHDRKPKQKDQSFGARAASFKKSDAAAEIRNGGAVGEKEITFVPQKRQARRAHQQDDERDGKQKIPRRDRRTASKNFMRNL